MQIIFIINNFNNLIEKIVYYLFYFLCIFFFFFNMPFVSYFFLFLIIIKILYWYWILMKYSKLYKKKFFFCTASLTMEIFLIKREFMNMQVICSCFWNIHWQRILSQFKKWRVFGKLKSRLAEVKYKCK